MSAYNVNAARKWFTPTAAFLATDMSFDAQDKPLSIKEQKQLEKRIDKWRDSTMQIIKQHQRAHERIETLQARVDELEQCVEDWADQAG